MSISTGLMPPSVALSNNMIPVEISSDKYFLSTGTKQVLTITFTDNTVNNKIITFGWKEFNMTMQFKTTPDDSGFQLPLYNKTLSTGYDSMIAAFKSNYYLTKYYVITSSVTFVSGNYQCVMTFTQRVFGQEFAAVTLTGDDPSKYTPAIATAQVMPTYNANFKLLCDIYWQFNPSSSQDYTKVIAELECTTDDTGLGYFNLNSIFSKWKELKPDFNYDAAFNVCSNVLRHYWLNIAESFGSPSLARNNITHPATIATNDYKQVLLGGLPFLSHISSSFLTDYIDAAENKFLTNQKNGATTVCKQQKHSLYFYLKNNVTDVVLKGKLYLDDGTDVAFTKYSTTGTITGKRVYSAGVGFDDLALGALIPSNKEAVAYEVWVTDGSNVRKTEIFKFEVDTRYYEYNHFFYFHNSLGGVDSAWMTGEVKTDPNFDGDELQIAISPIYTEGNIDTANSSMRYFYEFNTGWKEYKNEVELLSELLTSNYVKWLPDSKVRPGITTPMKMWIDKNSIKDWPNDTENIYSLTFKAAEAHIEYK